MTKIAAILTAILMASSAAANQWQQQSGNARQSSLQQQLNQQNAAIAAADRQTKYAKMNASAFVFYRGTAHLYYTDLHNQSIITASDFDAADAVTWIQGDLHVQNYGAFDDDEGDIVFDLNDFDEGWVDSYLYDVYRAAASLILVAEEQGFTSTADQRAFVDAFSEYYLDTLEDYRGNSQEKSAEVTKANAYGRLDEFLEAAEQDNSRSKMLNKWTDDLGSQRYFDLSLDDLAAPSQSERSALTNAIEQYHHTSVTSGLSGDNSYFKVLDVAKRLNAGTGSLGTTRYYVLIDGASTGDSDDRILDVKMQGLPSVYPYLSAASQANLLGVFPANQQGCRVVEAQKALLTDVDDHLGCVTVDGNSFSVRERSPFKESFDTTVLTSVNRFTKLAEQWGSILATAHARADKDHNSAYVSEQFESVMHDLTDTHHSEFRSEVFDFATSYAEQVKTDFALFQDLYLGQNGGLD